MLVHQFPDINMVRQLRNDAATPVNKWRNIALNIKCKQVSRTGVESPYSLFLNKTGHSFCRVGDRQYRVETDQFLFTRPGDVYDLEIDNPKQTEIFNIHINKDFVDSWAGTLITPNELLLDNSQKSLPGAPFLLTQLYAKDTVIDSLVNQLGRVEQSDTPGFDLVLGNIVKYLLTCDEKIRKQIAGLPATKAAVQVDIYRRMAIAKDYIYSNYNRTLDLDELSREVAVSKFHFLRLFKECYGISPYQYLAKVRLEKGARLLKVTSLSVNEIADDLGFEYPNSFIKAFQKSYGLPPLRFRKLQ